jgi:asparagine synthase (glutamine-hydrolysing)
MATPDGDAMLTFNGEVYDYDAVRESLAAQGDTFRSTGDTEVLLLALRRWGLGALARIHGHVRLRVLGRRDRALLLARDRFGKKPLYYAPLGGPDGREGVVFASELRALLAHPRVRAERAVDPAAVAQYLVHEFVPQPRSILANVRKLGAGEARAGTPRAACASSAGGARSTATRAAGRPPTSSPGSSPAASTARSQRRLVADVPVGSFSRAGSTRASWRPARCATTRG